MAKDIQTTRSLLSSLKVMSDLRAALQFCVLCKTCLSRKIFFFLLFWTLCFELKVTHLRVQPFGCVRNSTARLCFHFERLIKPRCTTNAQDKPPGTITKRLVAASKYFQGQCCVFLASPRATECSRCSHNFTAESYRWYIQEINLLICVCHNNKTGKCCRNIGYGWVPLYPNMIKSKFAFIWRIPKTASQSMLCYSARLIQNSLNLKEFLLVLLFRNKREVRWLWLVQRPGLIQSCLSGWFLSHCAVFELCRSFCIETDKIFESCSNCAAFGKWSTRVKRVPL